MTHQTSYKQPRLPTALFRPVPGMEVFCEIPAEVTKINKIAPVRVIEVLDGDRALVEGMSGHETGKRWITSLEDIDKKLAALHYRKATPPLFRRPA